MGVFAGQGDPAWSMAALWRAATADESARTGPGPKPALTLDAIVKAAIDVADSDGLAGLSMKAVGARFGRTAMALYTYVPGKDELVDLMVDQAHAELPTGYDISVGWRTAITAWARDLATFHQQHPWTLQVSFARPVLGPHEQNVVETVAAILHSTGLPPNTTRRIVGVLIHFVRAIATTAGEARLAASATGVSDADWWTARSGQLAQVAPDVADRYPMSTWLASGGSDELDGDADEYLRRQTEQTFMAGIAILLDGIETAIAEQS